jgi:tetratricopeptide (TPR) repeat protein
MANASRMKRDAGHRKSAPNMESARRGQTGSVWSMATLTAHPPAFAGKWDVVLRKKSHAPMEKDPDFSPVNNKPFPSDNLHFGFYGNKKETCAVLTFSTLNHTPWRNLPRNWSESIMKYTCNHCDITFESEKSDKVRCPECMGIHDVEPAQGKSTETGPKPKSKYFIPSLVLLVAIAGAVIYMGIQKQKQAPGADNAISSGDLRSQMETLGISAEDAIVPFETNDTIDAFARDAAGDASDVKALTAIYNKLLTLKKENRWTSYSQNLPRPEASLTAAELLDRINRGEAVEATSYEVACLLFASAQSVGVQNLKMVEILNFKKEKAPADPSAIYGRYAVVSGDALFDPWAGREEKASDTNLVVLDAAAATAPFYAHRSLSQFARMDMSGALKDNQIAVELAPDNALLKIHRGKIFLGSGAVQEALAEFEKAKKARDWAITRISLAQINLMTQSNLEETESAIRQTIAEFPEYHQAHALLAALNMMRGDTDSATQELKIAEKIAPASPEVAATQAQLSAMKGNVDEAIEYAQKSVRLSKENFQSLMILAQIYRATARFDEMREVARRALAKAPSEAVKTELGQLFGISDDQPTDESDNGEALAGDEDNDAETGSDNGLDLPGMPAVPGDLKLNLKNDQGAATGGGLKLGGNKRPGLGGDLKLEMNQ